MKTIYVMLFCFTFNANAQLTTIPDPIFEQALIDLGIDTGPINGSVPTVNVSSITSLVVNNLNIVDLTGIEDFTSLTYLDCSLNDFTSLDVTQNTLLTYLDCRWSSIPDLDITQNTLLTYLNASSNPLTSIDLTQNANLDTLMLTFNGILSSLDVTQNVNLIYLSFEGAFSTIDLSQNVNLKLLVAHWCQLAHLNVSANSSLEELYCSHNTQLTCLNLANGNNSNFTTISADSNPNLTCIEVDDIVYSNANWSSFGFSFDPTASFDTYCASCDPNASLANATLSSLSIHPNPTSGEVFISSNHALSGIISVRNSVGEVVYSETLSNSINPKIDLDVSPGIYFIRFQTGKTSETYRIVKN